IGGGPEKGVVQAFPSNRAHESFDEWMRDWRVGHRLDLFHVEYPQIRLPLVESVQRIMVRAEVGRRRLATCRSIEHPAQPDAIHDAAMHAKADDATRALIHHDEHPVCTQEGRLASKQIETPQTVLRMTEDREPRWPSRARFWLIPNGEN